MNEKNERSTDQVASINHSRCDNSPFCMVMKACPHGIVERKGGIFSRGKPEVNKEECRGCGVCVSYCPHSAVSMVTV